MTMEDPRAQALLESIEKKRRQALESARKEALIVDLQETVRKLQGQLQNADRNPQQKQADAAKEIAAQAQLKRLADQLATAQKSADQRDEQIAGLAIDLQAAEDRLTKLLAMAVPESNGAAKAKNDLPARVQLSLLRRDLKKIKRKLEVAQNGLARKSAALANYKADAKLRSRALKKERDKHKRAAIAARKQLKSAREQLAKTKNWRPEDQVALKQRIARLESTLAQMVPASDLQAARQEVEKGAAARTLLADHTKQLKTQLKEAQARMKGLDGVLSRLNEARVQIAELQKQLKIKEHSNGNEQSGSAQVEHTEIEADSGNVVVTIRGHGLAVVHTFTDEQAARDDGDDLERVLPGVLDPWHSDPIKLASGRYVPIFAVGKQGNSADGMLAVITRDDTKIPFAIVDVDNHEKVVLLSTLLSNC